MEQKSSSNCLFAYDLVGIQRFGVNGCVTQQRYTPRTVIWIINAIVIHCKPSPDRRLVPGKDQRTAVSHAIHTINALYSRSDLRRRGSNRSLMPSIGLLLWAGWRSILNVARPCCSTPASIYGSSWCKCPILTTQYWYCSSIGHYFESAWLLILPVLGSLS